MSAQIARIVVGNLLRVLSGNLKPSFADEFIDELCYVHDLEVHLELGILILECVIAVRGGDDDLSDPAVDECLDVLSGKSLE